MLGLFVFMYGSLNYSEVWFTAKFGLFVPVPQGQLSVRRLPGDRMGWRIWLLHYAWPHSVMTCLLCSACPVLYTRPPTPHTHRGTQTQTPFLQSHCSLFCSSITFWLRLSVCASVCACVGKQREQRAGQVTHTHRTQCDGSLHHGLHSWPTSLVYFKARYKCNHNHGFCTSLSPEITVVRRPNIRVVLSTCCTCVWFVYECAV